MLICALRAQDKDLKIELKNKCCNKLSFQAFTIMNAQFSILNFHI